MNQIKFYYKDCLISEEDLISNFYCLKEEIDHLNNSLFLKYDDDRASINLPDDFESLNRVKTLIEEKKKLSPNYLIVVGIGGSNLGTIAIQEAILGKLYNQLNPEIKIFYADTVDSDSINDIIQIIEPELGKNANVIVNGISKSGGTTETIANFQILVELIKKYKTDYEKYIIVTTDKNSKLWNLAIKIGFSVLEIPKKVGGRFSIFSPVGIFPLGLIGIDIDDLQKGAKFMRDCCLKSEIKENPAALSACIIYQHCKNKKNIHDTFIFSPDLESMGKWYRQLMSESIGKEYDKQHNQIFNGITPTVSIGSTDLHSMAQLYLGGPFDKFTTFIRVENNKRRIRIPNLLEFSNLVNNIQGKTLDEIMNAILNGVQNAFKNKNRPFIEIVLPDKSEESISQILQMKIIEIIYLGHLMNVNPFNQPNVEDYKKETKKFLTT